MSRLGRSFNTRVYFGSGVRIPNYTTSGNIPSKRYSTCYNHFGSNTLINWAKRDVCNSILCKTSNNSRLLLFCGINKKQLGANIFGMQQQPTAIPCRSMSTTLANGEKDKRRNDTNECNKLIKFNACGNLFEELKKTKPHLYRNAPKDGIDFECQYYDSIDLLTNNNNNNDANHNRTPIVCILHGAPGNYDEFSSLINCLTTNGIRVIAPNFPDYSMTYKYSFRHSPRERLEMLLEFFKVIKVNKIDMLIGHSSAIYTVLEFLNHSLNSDNKSTDRRVDIKSLALFSCPTYNLPDNLKVTPSRLFTLQMFDYRFLRPIFIALIQTYVKFAGIKNRVNKDKIEDLLIAAAAVGYSESEKAANHLELIKKYKIPTLIFYGCNDSLIPVRCFDQLKRDLNVKDCQLKRYNEDGKLIKDLTNPNELVEAIEFISGGHYLFRRFAEQLNGDVVSFIKRKVFVKFELKQNSGSR